MFGLKLTVSKNGYEKLNKNMEANDLNYLHFYPGVALFNNTKCYLRFHFHQVILADGPKLNT